MVSLDRPVPSVAVPVPEPAGGSRRIKLHLARNVTAARRRAGMTQLQLARAAELSRATIHLVEAGLGDPRLSTIVRLAEALNLGPLDLMADTV